MKLNKISIGKKIGLCFLVPILVMGIICFWTYRVSGSVLENAIQTKEESIVFAMLAQSMKKDVVQVQQFLTDISATRGQDGLNDGFDEAKKNADSFIAGLDRFKKLFAEKNDTDSAAKVEQIRASFDEYYKVGKQMAQAYVDGGPPAGNKLMGGTATGGFDARAKDLSEKLDPFVEAQSAKSNSMMDSIIASVNRLKTSILVMFTFSLVFIGVLTTWLTKVITEPVSDTVEVVKQIAAGDFTREVPVKTEDEMGVLGTSVNKMVSDLREMFAQITSNSKYLATSSEKMSEVSGRLAAGSEMITSQASGVASATEQMSANISSMAAGIEESSVNASTVSSTAEQMSANMRSIASAIEEMSITIRDVAKNSEDTSRIANKAMESSNAATETMKELGKAANEIGKVTQMIKRIAEQTNLLALNATIEAASAGDAGKGFAVVANEIKELANQSAHAAEDITAKIEGVQARTHDAVKVITDVSGIIDQISAAVNVITNAVHQQTLAANEISKNVLEVTTGANNIASSISEVAKGASDMSKSAGEAAKGANEVASNIQSINKGVSENSIGIQQVKASSSELAKIADDLQEMVAKFKVDGNGSGKKTLSVYRNKTSGGNLLK